MNIPANFQGAALRLQPSDIAQAAAMLGCEPAAVQAVLSVETDGSGFDDQGRPSIEFEPHIFYRLLTGAERDAAVAHGLAYSQWGLHPYPPDSYPRLIAARLINETAALQSASWGIAQIMGFNFREAGYDDVQSMVAAACESEAAQLDMMVRFMLANQLDQALTDRDWDAFARGYNGTGQVAYYAAQMAAAYNSAVGSA